jgi:IS30 family transposase
LASNPALRAYVEEGLAGRVTNAEGIGFAGPDVVWKKRRAVLRQRRRWSIAWRPEQIAHWLRLDYPEDSTMRISHEVIYQGVKNGPPLAGHGAEAVRKALAETMRELPEKFRQSLTWDQGAEMAQHATLRVDSGLEIYFCNPQSPWQRGSNENTNGLLRQYFPKGTDLGWHSIGELEAVAHAMNTRPRKTLGWKTPAEVLDQFLAPQYEAGVATTG